MIFHQLFDPVSCTYTYLIARRQGGEALLIDPVYEQVPVYLDLLEELDLKLVQAIDTHFHADHVTGLGSLRHQTGCIAAMGEQTACELVDIRVGDGDKIKVDGLVLDAIHTPGHTQDSFCFVSYGRAFTGDTLLIGATGRTDFEGGDPAAQYESLFNRLLRLDDSILVFPGHDYKGRRVSTIGAEKSSNPRLQAKNLADYVETMSRLDLPPPKQMDVAVPMNLRMGIWDDG
jgi:sulfur dioxygenase